jgi:hypothetical protein
MGKRSDFLRHERDWYATPLQAVPALIPHLRGVRTFAEPCCGDGALVRHLESFGLRCAYAADIADGHDALARDAYGDADAIITNPPYTRELMHKLIAHFQCIARTWLLLELDWASTKQARPYLPACSDIVNVGRLCLFPETRTAGKQNFAWFCFAAEHANGPIFHADPTAPSSCRCSQCGTPYPPSRTDSRFCSNRCRQRAYRERVAVT